MSEHTAENDACECYTPQEHDRLGHNAEKDAPCRTCGGTGRDPLDPSDPCPGMTHTAEKDAGCGHPNHGNPDHDCKPFVTAEKDAGPLAYLRELQAEADRGFHRRLHAWVDDRSSVALALRAYATRVIPPGNDGAA